MFNRTALHRLFSFAVIVSMLLAISGQVVAQGPQPPDRTAALKHIKDLQTKRITNADRYAAAARAKAGQSKTATLGKQSQAASPLAVTAPAAPAQGGTPNYFGPEPNWAQSPLPTVNPISGTITGGIRKFIDSLPQLTPAGANNLGQYLAVATPDTTTYPGSDYYEIALVEYTEKMHTDLLPTTLRGYVQLETSVIQGNHYALTYPNGNPILNAAGQPVFAVDKPHYLGPSIVAMKDRPVRVKFTNFLPTGAGGNLFLPVDTTEMGAGMGPLGMNTTPGYPMDYTQNRATLHLHGGNTVWISDGTAHQWITPAGEQTDYPKGVSAQNVPDMPDPGPGSETFFYSNQQSARLMFYHDHAYGITRLNVYGGEAAGYVLTDAVEQDLITRGILPGIGVPLIIQDKSFVDPSTVLTTDPTWPFALNPALSNLWYPHVYMPNQNPNDLAGVNALGRWDYGPWFWPPWPTTNAPITNPDGTVSPNLPDLSMTMEAYHDTALVNGTAYPYMNVDPKAYRFRILNAANDRFWNLQLYQASSIVGGLTLTGGGSGYTTLPAVTITPAAGDTTGHGASATATIDPATGAVTAVTLVSVGSGYTAAPIVTIAPPTTVGGVAATATATLYAGSTEVGMVPAVQGAAAFPLAWSAQTPGMPGDILDGRSGGVPDPALIGPSMIQIGTEGGFLPAPVVWPNIPLGYDRDPKSITVGNVKEHNLWLGNAERADVVIDFSQFAGKTIILYNDSCAACPATDSRLDYYTSDLDATAIGGTTPTLPGYGPNTRTIMQFRVANTAPAPAYNLAALQAEFASTATTQGVFAKSQDPIIVPQAPYNTAYNASFPAGTTAYGRIQSTSLTFTPMGAAAPVTVNFQPKAIQELFENTFGRMSAYLGVEIKFTNGLNQTTIDYGYIDPPTEDITDTANPAMTPIGTLGDGTQIWKITHNGVDTHPVHFHLFNVQVLNRVDWAGVVKPPEANELGWKDTVRMNPLEDIIVAMRPVAAKVPFGVPDSIRPLDPTMPLGSTTGFRNVDPNGNPVTTVNQLFNFGWEYVWHCHILSHEEMDMMRAIVFNVARALSGAPVLSASGTPGNATLNWIDPTPANAASTLGNPSNEIGFRIERSANGGAFAPVGTALANATTFIDTTPVTPFTDYAYRVVAFNVAGETPSNVVVLVALPAAPSNLVATAASATQVNLTWADNSSNETGFQIQRATGAGAFATIATVGSNTTSFADTTVAAVTTYSYQVVAVNSGGSSAPSNVATVTTPSAVTPPAAPTNLAASLLSNPMRVRLTWTDNATNETGFAVERAIGTGAFAVIANLGARTGTGSMSYTDFSVAPGSSYTYRVRAVRGTVSSAYSNNATVNVPTGPAAPSGLTATGARAGFFDSVTLGWTDNANNETSFTIQRSTNATFTANLVTVNNIAANSTQYTQTGVPRRTRYYYRIRAVNAAGASAWSNVVNLLTP